MCTRAEKVTAFSSTYGRPPLDVFELITYASIHAECHKIVELLLIAVGNLGESGRGGGYTTSFEVLSYGNRAK